VQLKGENIKASPFAVTVKPANPDASKSTAAGDGIAHADTDKPAQFVVTTRDRFGNECIEGGFKVTATLAGKGDIEGQSITATVADQNNGKYNATYQPKKAGAYVLSVSLNGAHIKDSPFNVKVEPGKATAGNTVASGDGLKRVVAGETGHFTVQTKDANNNNLTKGGDAIAGKLSGAANDVAVTVKDNSNGTYAGSYVPKIAGDYKLDVTYAGALDSGRAVQGAGRAGGAERGQHRSARRRHQGGQHRRAGQVQDSDQGRVWQQLRQRRRRHQGRRERSEQREGHRQRQGQQGRHVRRRLPAQGLGRLLARRHAGRCAHQGRAVQGQGRSGQGGRWQHRRRGQRPQAGRRRRDGQVCRHDQGPQRQRAACRRQQHQRDVQERQGERGGRRQGQQERHLRRLVRAQGGRRVQAHRQPGGRRHQGLALHGAGRAGSAERRQHRGARRRHQGGQHRRAGQVQGADEGRVWQQLRRGRRANQGRSPLARTARRSPATSRTTRTAPTTSTTSQRARATSRSTSRSATRTSRTRRSRSRSIRARRSLATRSPRATASSRSSPARPASSTSRRRTTTATCCWWAATTSTRR
jgi:hypothetical protein